MPSWGDVITKNGIKEKHFPLHRGQFDLLNSDKRFIAAIAGTGSGKTALACLWLMKEIQKHPRSKFLLVAPTYKTLRSSTLPTWKATVADTDLEGEHKVADSEYLCTCGATIYLRSAEDPRCMQGCVANAAVIDEGGLITKEAWDTVLQRVGYKKGRVLITTTPYSFNFLYKEVYTRWKAGDKNYYVCQFPSILNPTYPTDEYERAKATLPLHKFKMLYDGEFCKAAGLVYSEMESCIIEMPKALPDGRLVGGIDFGFNDPFSAVAGVLDKDGVLWLFFERYMRSKTLAEHSPHLPPSVQWFADSARPDSIKDLRRMGHWVKPCKKGAGSIAYGISLVHERIKDGTLKLIRGTTPALLEESEQYHYPSSEDNSAGDTPIDEHNHALDALRYLITAIDRKKRRD